MNDEMIGKKLQHFFNNSIPLHLDTISDRFYNGYVQEIGADYLMLSDFKLGPTLIFFAEIKILEPYIPKGALE